MIIILMSAALLCAVTSQAQENVYKPYVSVGANRTEGTMSYGAEFGLYNTNTWWSLAASYSEGDYYSSFKNYNRVFNIGKLQNYIYGALNLKLAKGSFKENASLEPGWAFVYNSNSKFAPQFTVSFPIALNGGHVPVSLGLGLNYWVK